MQPPIESTIDLQEASRSGWDVIVIGGGPAGSAAAITLAQSRSRVLLVDKAEHPRFKVCGCCLNDVAVNILECLGFSRNLEALHAVPIATIDLHAGRHNAQMNLSHGRVVSRAALDAALIRHSLDSGAEYLSKVTASVGLSNSNSNSNLRVVELVRGEEVVQTEAKCIVIADGLNGHSLDRSGLLPVSVSPNSRIGAGAIAKRFPPNLFENGIIYMTCGQGGYVGMVKMEDSTLDVAAAFDRSFVQLFKSPGEAANHLIRHTRLASLNLSELPWHGTAGLTRQRSAVSAPGIFVVGDAASYAEPFTGEGMSWALASGLSVCAIVKKYIASLAAGTETFQHSEWDAVHEMLVSRKQRSSLLLAQFLRYPRLVESVTMLLAAAPFLADPIIRSLNRPASVSIISRGSM